jgi:hypothetical protein
MATRSTPGLLGAIRIDLKRLHETWMELLFPRQLDASSVLGKWKPKTTPQTIAYRAWAALGVPLVAIGYPLLLLGFGTRFYVRRIDSATTRLGLAGVVAVSLLAWALLSLFAYLRQFSYDGLVAVVAAGIVATISAAAAVVFSRIGGRGTSVALAYPAGVTAIFLPPVVAALYSPVLGSIVFPGSTNLAIWILDNLLIGGLSEFLRENFQLEGIAYVGMWFGIAVPLGWFLGAIVALADLIRPKAEG